MHRVILSSINKQKLYIWTNTDTQSIYLGLRVVIKHFALEYKLGVKSELSL